MSKDKSVRPVSNAIIGGAENFGIDDYAEQVAELTRKFMSETTGGNRIARLVAVMMSEALVADRLLERVAALEADVAALKAKGKSR